MIFFFSSVLQILLYILSVAGSLTDTAVCSGDGDCGWNSYCDHGQCWCLPGYQRRDDSSHCLDNKCSVSDCVQCLDEKVCKRCVTYLLSGEGRCVDRCSTEYSLMLHGDELGRVCQGESSGISMVYVSIIVAAVSAVLVIILLALAIHFKIRTDKERDLRLKLMGDVLKKKKKVFINKELIQSKEWDNYSYASSDEEIRLKRLHYYHQVTALQPQLDTFLAILRDAKLKCRTLGPNDSRQLLYRNMIHQLCRVLTVINDRMAAMPTDGNLLLDWAQRVLTDYKRYHKSSSSPSSSTPSRCWTLPNGFRRADRLMNGSLPAHMINHTSGSRQSSSPRQQHEANREVAEISGIQILADLTDPIEV